MRVRRITQTASALLPKAEGRVNDSYGPIRIAYLRVQNAKRIKVFLEPQQEACGEKCIMLKNTGQDKGPPDDRGSGNRT